MKWPWVARAEHERIVAEIDEANRRCIEQMRRVTERLFDANADVVEKYHALAAPKPPPVVTSLDTAPLTLTPAPEADAITKTIREEAGRDTHLAQHLRKYSRELKQQGLTDDEIVGKLVAWQTSEPEDHVASA